MPDIIDTILTNNVTDRLDETTDSLNLTDQASAFFQNRSPESLNELRCWLLVVRCIGDNDILEVAKATKARKANHLNYLTAHTRIKVSRPNYLHSHHEKIQGMNCYTEDRMSDLIKWTTPTIDYNPAKREADRITLYPKTATPHDFNERWDKASNYLMGEDTARQKSLFQMTIRQNLDSLIRLGPNIRAFDINNIPRNKTTDLQQSLEFALLGCRMILANFTPKPLGLYTTPKTTYINEKVRLETTSLLQANEDLVHKRLPTKLVEIVEQSTKYNHAHHNIYTPFLEKEKYWKGITDVEKGTPSLQHVGI